MHRSKTGKPEKHGHYSDLERLFEKGGARPVHFMPSITLSLLTAALDSIGKGLLIPVVRGMVSMDYSFVKRAPIISGIMSELPLRPLTSNISIFIFLLGLILSVVLAQNFAAYFASISFAYQVRVFANNVRKGIYNRYLNFGKLFFDNENFGHLGNILIDFTNIITARVKTLQQVFIEIFRLYFYLILLVLISWKLTVIVVLVFPISHYLLNRLIDKIKRTSGDLAISRNSLSKKIFNVISNIPLVKLYTREGAEKENFSKMSDETARLEFSIDKKLILVSPLQNIFMFIAMTLLIAVMAFMILKEKMNRIGDFLVYIYVLRSGTSSFGTINIFRSILADISGPVKRILWVFDDSDKDFVFEGNEIFGGLKNTIEFNHLNFSYVKDQKVLHDVTFSIQKGKITAIVGPSGSGKTTIISLLLRFYNCPPGTILINGADIRNFTLKSLLVHMAYVSQNTLLFNDTLKNNIIYGLNNVGQGRIEDALKRARLYDFAIQLPKGLETPIGDQGIQLSGGERQRASIARALLKNSEILILDEATSSLDSGTERLIQEAIDEVVKGRTTIVIAHRLSTIKNCDTIIIVEDGRILEQGSLSELLEKKGRFYRYWEEQKFY